MPPIVLFLPCRYNVMDDLCSYFLLDFVWVWLFYCGLEVELLLVTRGNRAVEELAQERTRGSLTVSVLDE